MEQENNKKLIQAYKDSIEWLLLVIQNQKERIERLEKMIKEDGSKEWISIIRKNNKRKEDSEETRL